MVSHSVRENGGSEPIIPPKCGLCLHLQASLMVGKPGSKERSELCCEMYRLKTQIVVLLHVEGEFREILNVELISESEFFVLELE